MPGWLKAGLIGAAVLVLLNLIGLIPLLGCIVLPLQLLAYAAIGALAASYIPPLRAAGQGASQGALAALVAGLASGVVGLIISIARAALVDPAAALSQVPPEALRALQDAGISPELLAGVGGASLCGSVCCLGGMLLAAGLGAIGGAIYASAKSS
ncbi:MAG: hypothetical protein JXA78_02660 [Anaerolineales bacterium]|nr:hypothetical protein [Anaerolineales bacterium]